MQKALRLRVTSYEYEILALVFWKGYNTTVRQPQR